VSLLVAILGTPSSPAEALDAFHQAWGLMAIGGLGAAAIAVGLGRVRATGTEPVEVAAAA
jgi:hypothetical protein